MRPPRGPRPLAMPLTDRQRAILEDMVHSRRRPHDEVQRATIILQSADGARTRHLAEALQVSDPTVRLWRRRWAHAAPQLAAAEAEADEETLRRCYAMSSAVDGRPRVPRSSSARSWPSPVKSPRPPTGR